MTISLIVWQNDNLNNKAHEVNSRPINICGEWSVTFIDNTERTGNEKNLNESKLYLNKSGRRKFGKNICEFIMLQNGYGVDNNNSSGNAKRGSGFEISNSALGENIRL